MYGIATRRAHLLFAGNDGVGCAADGAAYRPTVRVIIKEQYGAKPARAFAGQATRRFRPTRLGRS